MVVRFPWRKNKEGLRWVPRGNTLVLSIYRMQLLGGASMQVISFYRLTRNVLLCIELLDICFGRDPVY
jgi:hypothetical protein